jgi:TRAP transporter TAXI family solute receptor
VNGLYFPAGGALCRMLTRQPNSAGLRCLVESTSGSTANVRGLRNGELDFGIVQSDWQYYAVQGNGVFKANGPVKELRSVFSLYPESLTVIARQDSGIASFEQIKGKRIAAGPQGSGQRLLFDSLIAAYGWRQQDAGTLSEATDRQAADAFCDGTIDVVVMMTHHPAPFVQDMISRCQARFVPVAGPPVAKLMRDRPYYAPSVIPADAYRGLEGDTQTLGVRATLVTSAAVPDDVVYALVKAVFDNFDRFKAQHPGLGELKRDDMVKAGLSAPMHDGAKRYFKEKGLLP